MRNVLIHYTTAVWLLLALLTGLSWWLGEQTAVNSNNFGVISTTMLLVGFFKVRLIGLHFMELRHAPLPLRFIFEAWVVVVCAIILGLYWL